MSTIDPEGLRGRIASETIRAGMPARAATPPAGAASFGNMLEGLMSETSKMQNAAEGEVAALVKGERTDVHEVMLAVAKADVSFKFMLEVRNKLLEAYQEVMRMQV